MSRSRQSRSRENNRQAQHRKRELAKRKASSLSGRSSAALLDEAADLLADGQFDELQEKLEDIEGRFPNQVNVLEELLSFYVELNDMHAMQRVADRCLRLAPRSFRFLLSHAGSCLANGWVMLALESFEKLMKWHPDEPEVANVRETVESIRERVQAGLHNDELLTDELCRQLTENERLQVAQQDGNLAEAAKIGERVLASDPNVRPILNSLTQVYWQLGQSAKAIATAEKSLALDAAKIHPLANLSRLHFLAGRRAEAQQYAHQLLEIPNQCGDDFVKKAETLSFLGEDSAILELLSQSRETSRPSSIHERALLLHYAATANARLGHNDAARMLWEESLQLNPFLDLASENLADQEAPVGKQNGPWAFGPQPWIPRTAIEYMLGATRPANDSTKSDRGITDILTKFPDLRPTSAALLERGDDRGREIAIIILLVSKDPGLAASAEEFALSTRGTDERRLEAIETLVRIGALPEADYRIWTEGEWRTTHVAG